MGVIRKVFGGSGGIRCTQTEEGLRCQTYEKEGQDKLGTGTDFTMTIDPDTCKAQFSGGFDIAEGDEARVAKIKQELETQCRKGL